MRINLNKKKKKTVKSPKKKYIYIFYKSFQINKKNKNQIWETCLLRLETSVFFESSIVHTTVSKGKVPHEVGRLFRLPPELELTNNSLQKHTAANQSSCSKLKILGFASCFDPDVLVFVLFVSQGSSSVKYFKYFRN